MGTGRLRVRTREAGVAWLCVMLISACSHSGPSIGALPSLRDVRANLAFTCTHEADHLPSLNPDADQLFHYARYLEKWPGKKNYNDIARYYRIAAAYGHYKANHNLQQLVSEGWADSPYPQRESIELAKQLVDQGVPIGYYDIGYYLNLGYGFKQNKEIALRYFRKAADLGNPDAQYYVADLLSPWNMAPNVASQMYQCSMNQGYGDAAFDWGIYLKGEENYAEAAKAFQKGVEAGNSLAASSLENAFLPPAPADRLRPPSDQLYYLALPNDPERSRRYHLIGEFLDRNDGRNPKVPDIDKIVPLPPAALPAWDGTFEWEKEQKAHIPPKPSEELIERMSRLKHLDPATGLPLPPPLKTAFGTRVKTGEPCPESGLWCVRADQRLDFTETRIEKGDVMPPYRQYKPRRLSVLDDLLPLRHSYWNVEWELVDYV